MLCKMFAMVVGMSSAAALMVLGGSISSGGRTKEEFPTGT